MTVSGLRTLFQFHDLCNFCKLDFAFLKRSSPSWSTPSSARTWRSWRRRRSVCPAAVRPSRCTGNTSCRRGASVSWVWEHDGRDRTHSVFHGSGPVLQLRACLAQRGLGILLGWAHHAGRRHLAAQDAIWEASETSWSGDIGNRQT